MLNVSDGILSSDGLIPNSKSEYLVHDADIEFRPLDTEFETTIMSSQHEY